MDDSKPKYLYDAGGTVSLFGLDKLKCEQNDVVITEGELDSLVLWSKNIQAVSSTGGAMTFREEWIEELKSMCHGTIYLAFDNDDAGSEGMVRVLKHLPEAKVIFIPEQPDVKDISDFVSKGGDFHALMATAKSYADITAVEEDMQQRRAQWLPTRFHKKYIDANRPQQRTQSEASTYTGTDEVLRARSYPLENLVDFKGKQAKCLWHKEKTPSLAHYPKTNSAYCWGSCGRAYDSIDAYRKKTGASFTKAVKELNELL